jgi:hypothetical protein
MVEPRKPKDIKRIIKQANYASAEADLREFDKLLSEETCVDPSLKLSRHQKRARSTRELRLKFLSERLFKDSR